MRSSKKNRGRERRANRQAKATTLEKCAHAHTVALPLGHVLLDAITVFETAFQQFSHSAEKGSIAVQVLESIRKDYPKVLFDNENRSKMKEMLLTLGTEALLSDERPLRARTFAESIARISHWNRCLQNKSKTRESAVKRDRQVRDLYGDGKRSVIRFFAKRVPCACLDKMKDEAKRQAKQGTCYNCHESFDFHTLLECSCCSIVHYCSKDCQRGDRNRHKQDMKRISTDLESLGV